jgi:hypothetical protein
MSPERIWMSRLLVGIRKTSDTLVFIASNQKNEYPANAEVIAVSSFK